MWRPPSSAETAHIGKLTTGVRLDTRGTDIPDGGFTELDGYVVQPQGPTRRNAFTSFSTGEIPHTLLDLVGVWKTDGTQQLVALTDRTLHLIVPGVSSDEIDWSYSTGTVTAAGVTLTGSGTNWLSADVQVGDLYRLASGGYEAYIVSVDSDTEITLGRAAVADFDGAYVIQRAFGSGETASPDFVSFNNYLLVADGSRPLIAYDVDTGTIDYWINDPDYYIAPGVTFAAGTVAYFMDRVWAAFTTDSVDGIQRQRIRWSGLANTRDFSFTTNYVDLPYVGGAILKLAPLGNLLMAYFEDTIYRGIPTNNPNLPLRWERVETGGIGLINNKSVVPFVNGHFWIGNDNFYFTNGEVVEQIGEPVVSRAFGQTRDFTAVRAAADIEQRCAVFGMRGESGYFRDLYTFNYITKAWSISTVRPSTALSSPVVNDPITWDTLPATTWEDMDTYYMMWNSIGKLSAERSLFLGATYKFWIANPDAEIEFEDDGLATPRYVSTLAQTPDHSFGDEDWMKSAVRFSLKIQRPPGTTARALSFILQGSSDQGVSYRTLGTMNFTETQMEAYCTFRFTGATMRFWIEAAPVTVDGVLINGAHTITGYSVRLAGRGAELALRA